MSLFDIEINTRLKLIFINYFLNQDSSLHLTWMRNRGNMLHRTISLETTTNIGNRHMTLSAMTNNNVENADNTKSSNGLSGDNVGLLLRGVQRDEVRRGMVIAKPGSIKGHSKFDSETYILTKEEGGRHTPFFVGYRPQFYVRTTDVTGNIVAYTSDDGKAVEMVLPGDRIKMTVQLGLPIAIEQGMKFAIREGGKTIGAGVVTKILD